MHARMGQGEFAQVRAPAPEQEHIKVERARGVALIGTVATPSVPPLDGA